MSRLDDLLREMHPDQVLTGANGMIYDLVRELWPNSSLEFARRVENQLKEQLSAERCRVCGCTRLDTCKLNGRVYQGPLSDSVAFFRTFEEAIRYAASNPAENTIIKTENPHPYYCRLESRDICTACIHNPARFDLDSEPYQKVPKHLRGGLYRYFAQKIPTGGFLKSILEGRIKESGYPGKSRADAEEIAAAVLEIDPYRMAHGVPEICRDHLGEEKYNSWR